MTMTATSLLNLTAGELGITAETTDEQMAAIFTAQRAAFGADLTLAIARALELHLDTLREDMIDAQEAAP
jgi:hypothetical protein